MIQTGHVQDRPMILKISREEPVEDAVIANIIFEYRDKYVLPERPERVYWFLIVKEV